MEDLKTNEQPTQTNEQPTQTNEQPTQTNENPVDIGAFNTLKAENELLKEKCARLQAERDLAHNTFLKMPTITPNKASILEEIE